MIEILVPALLGSMLGAVAGLIPVVGTFASLLLVYPYLLDSSVAQILTFFVCLSSVSQFTGSVPALLLKIPGESSSLIAIKESSNILKQNLAGEAIAITALGSFFAGIGAMLFTYLFLGMLDQFTATAFSNTVLTVLLLMLIVLFCVNNTNTVAVNIVFIASGLGLGLIGYNSLLSESILTFNNNDLRTGLPLYPVITGVFVVNEIIKGQYQYQNTELKITSGLRHFNIFSWFRGTVIGYLGGFLLNLKTFLSVSQPVLVFLLALFLQLLLQIS
jgi:putative tricarboxylic transport membrane protein